jgi:hypothetical protein
MEKSNSAQITPPTLISSLTIGFNAVANNIYLILFPLGLDLLLWFGPHFRIRELALPLLNSLLSSMNQMSTPELTDVMRTSTQIWNQVLEQFNLLTALRTFPIGLPSLLTLIGPLKTPLGYAPIYELTSFASVFAMWLGLMVVGLILGTIYFTETARVCRGDKKLASLEDMGKLTGQAVIMTLSIVLLLLILSVPIMIMVTILGVFSPFLAQIALFMLLLFLLWILLPLFFAPFGIFLYRQNAFTAMLTSARTVRASLPGTSLFLLILIIISQGMNTLWRVPPETSWMMLVGVIGHAFISTSLLASCFIYYQKGVEWLQTMLKQQVHPVSHA